jgi:hypothetical protein
MVEEEWVLTVEAFLIAYTSRKEGTAGIDAAVKTGERSPGSECSLHHSALHRLFKFSPSFFFYFVTSAF